jgi:hypothetical protein
MSTSVMRTMRKPCPSEEATIRSMIEAVRGEDPVGGRGSLIDSA